MNYRNYFNLLSITAFVLILVSSCTLEEDIIPVEEELKFNIQTLDNNEFGYILSNQNYQSIYFFAGDVSGNQSNCNGDCAYTWPPVIGDPYDLALDANLSAADFGTTTREDGQKQLTFKGWPLYYFAPDGDGVLEAPNQVLGDGRGGVFHVAKPDYTVLLAKQPVTEGGEDVIYLVNDRGVTIYLNTADEENVSNCSGGCAEVWPIVEKVEKILAPSSLDAYDFDSFYRTDDLGGQMTYKGSPLYYFIQDEFKKGVVLGQAGGPNQTFFVIDQD